MHKFIAQTIRHHARCDAKRETAIAAGIPDRSAVPDREDGEFALRVNGQSVVLVLKPDRRHCLRWYAFRDGEPYLHGGLEQIWRKVQRELCPMMSLRRLDG